MTRRSFLVRAAIVGSALTVAPMRWMLRPTSAYATVCGTGASCGSGWTVFCCTINAGANTCPPGSYAAGWWKIDRSPFCNERPRYIIDCNRSPGSSCNCHCASGTCDSRRVCCQNFRYGQCNTQVPGVTEVVCRVVLCTTPWEWDPACGRTVRTDNRTRTHNAPCQPGINATPIDLRYQDLGLTGSVLGSPAAAEAPGPRSGSWRRFENGVIAHHGSTGTRTLFGELGREYAVTGGPAGPLGYPTTDHQDVAGGFGERVQFERGDLYLHDGNAHAIVGPAAVRYRELGGPAGALGAPTAGTEPVGDGRGSVTSFTGGAIYASGRIGAQAVVEPFLVRYEALGGPGGSGLGYPLAATESGLQPFENGLLVTVDGQVLVLRDAIARRYRELGGASGPWGALTADQDRVGPADVAVFEQGSAYAGPETAAALLTEPVLSAYLDADGPDGDLGLPTGDSFVTRVGNHRGSFQGGALEVHRVTGAVERFERRSTRSASELSP